MAKITTIHASKQPRRPHFIPEWADRRNLRQADISEEIGADKSLVSRWYKGATPGEEWQAKLAALFHCKPASLFRHPDEDWLAQFFADRKQEEIDRIKATLEAAFPRQPATLPDQKRDEGNPGKSHKLLSDEALLAEQALQIGEGSRRGIQENRQGRPRGKRAIRK